MGDAERIERRIEFDDARAALLRPDTQSEIITDAHQRIAVRQEADTVDIALMAFETA